MDKKERLKKAVDYLKLKNGKKLLKEFAEFANIDRSTLSSALNGNELYLTDSFLYKFVARFPEISREWLLAGEGEMLRDISVSQSNTINQSGNNSGNASITDPFSVARAIDILSDDLARKDTQIAKSQEQIDRLITIIETMNINK